MPFKWLLYYNTALFTIIHIFSDFRYLFYDKTLFPNHLHTSTSSYLQRFICNIILHLSLMVTYCLEIIEIFSLYSSENSSYLSWSSIILMFADYILLRTHLNSSTAFLQSEYIIPNVTIHVSLVLVHSFELIKITQLNLPQIDLLVIWLSPTVSH